MQMSSHDLLCHYFEHDKVRMLFARVAGENLVSPDEKAQGLGTFVFVGFLEAYGIGVPIGGSGKLTDALIASIKDHGGEVLAGVDVERVIVNKGRAQGAHTKDGRDFLAKDAVIGAIHPHHLGRMVAGVDPLIVRDAEATEISPGAHVAQLHARRLAWRRHVELPDGRAPAHARSRADDGARGRSPLPRRAVPASGRRCVRRGPRGRASGIRRIGDVVPVKVFGADNKELMTVTAIERQGNELIVKGKIFGTMPMTAKLRPAEVRQALKLLGFKNALFAFTMLFRG